ncbi:MAG: type II toxin-antitoxin system RelE/ParE family toxin [Isosphaeraceae bacterium]|jgi:mRNA interferase RelE/StbE
MMLDISKSAKSFLEALPGKQYKQIAERVLGLSVNQDPHDSRHLSGYPGYKRIDQGEYRIVFYVEGNVIRVPCIGKRNDDEVYRQLGRKG